MTRIDPAPTAPHPEPPPPAPADLGVRRIAAIDVGTNSLRLIIAEARPDGSYRVLDDEKEITRLGEGADSARVLGEIPMRRTAAAIGRLKAIAEGYGVREMRVVATSAVREAENADEMVMLVRDETGAELEIISGLEEARLATLSAEHAFDLRHEPVAIVDVGGGSTEIVLAVNGVIEHVWSLPLGAVRLTERFGPCDEPDGASLAALRKHIKNALRDAGVKTDVPPTLLCGSGGTFTNLARISMRDSLPNKGRDALPFATRGYEMRRGEVRHILGRLARLPVAQRADVPGLSPERADIIVAGVAIVDRVMKRLGVNRLRVNDGGVRDGLLLEMASSVLIGAGPAPNRRRVDAAHDFARACRYEASHADHVAWLSLRLFDQLVAGDPAPFEDGWTVAQARELLEAAALLHDVGYLISYTNHHKHSYHIIMHGDLVGFTSRERAIIANVARYHRRSEPKKKHTGFARLPAPDRALVVRLAAILRVADGLDRTHTQSVGDAILRREHDGFSLRVLAPSESAVDIWGAERKSPLFERAFGGPLRTTWLDPEDAA